MKIQTPLIICGLVSLASAQISINPATRQFQDESGRSVLFHGVNMVYKVDPYIPSSDSFDPQYSLTDAEIDQLREWGFNFVRLGVMWEAVERAPGVYNDTYLDQVEALINKLGSRGIHTLVDAHQDVLARRICGEGMPDFYAKDSDMPHVCEPGILPYIFPFMNFCKSMKDYPFRYDGDGNPLIEDCQKNQFVNYYFSPESMDLFEKLYTAGPTGLQDQFVSYWVHVAQRFAQNPFVVGYDPLNEPFPSNIYKDASLFYEPGRFEKVTLQPMYKRIFEEAYQPANPSKLNFFEPSQIPEAVFPVGFTQIPGNPNTTHLHVLNDHAYGPCALSELNESYWPTCKEFLHLKVALRGSDAARLGVPLIMSEFGACMGGPTCAYEIESMTAACDEQLASWSYWQYKKLGDLTTTAGTGSEGLYDDDGTLQSGKVKALTRTYVQAAQGVIVSNRFNTSDSRFEAQIIVNTGIQKPTTIYFNNQYWYPDCQILQIFLIDYVRF